MKLAAWLAALVAIVGGAVALNDVGREDDVGSPGDGDRQLGNIQLASLEAADSCGQVETFFEDAIEKANEAMGGDDVAVGRVADEDAMLESTTDQAASAPTAGSTESGDAGGGTGGGDGAQDFSGTNVQEESVDEPDVVKTDGELIVAAVGGRIQVIDAASEDRVATIDLPGETGGGEELLLNGDRLLVVGRTFREGRPMPIEDGAGESRIAMDMVAPGEETTTLTAIDLSNPEDPEVLGTAELDGGYVSARMVGETARIVLRQYPQVTHAEGDVRRLEVDAAEVLPAIAIDGGEPEPVPCTSVFVPPVPAGPGTTTVVTLDVTGDLEPIDTDTVVADAQTIYASTDRLYVATQTWNARTGGDDIAGSGDVTTELHAFATGSADGTEYLGSGQAPGSLLNQFSLSEHEGVLRVATTENENESMVTTFVEEDGELRQAGQVRGLGPGERIYAVRYLGNTAYVVTFRQTDPLYAIDLSDPSDPTLLGELKIPGFSSYLHPIGDGRLLGVGQDATDEGQRLGTQVSLFDVSDPASPARLDTVQIEHGNSPVEYDHRAFLWWGPTATAVVPVEVYDPGVIEPMPMPEPQPAEDEPMPVEPDGGPGSTGGGSSGSSGGSGITAAPEEMPQPELFALAVRVDGNELAESGRVSHADRSNRVDYPPMILRSLVVGEVLWTLSDAGLLASDLDGLDDRTWVEF